MANAGDEGGIPAKYSRARAVASRSAATAKGFRSVRELARVSKPGCVFCLTLEPRRFIDFIAGIPDDTSSTWYKLLSKHKPRLAEYYRQYDAGNLAFMPTNEGLEDRYGDAVVPTAFIKKNWVPYFTMRDYIDKQARFWQAVLVAQRVH